MNGFGLRTAELCHAFGRPSGRRCQRDPPPGPVHQLNDGLDDGGLSRTGPAGNDQGRILEHTLHRLQLRFGQLDSGVCLHLLYEPADFIHIRVKYELRHGKKAFCHAFFRIIIEPQIESVVFSHIDQNQLLPQEHF